jgi:restriction system protein
VSRPEIYKFVGALQGKKARKGIFITAPYFSKQAKDYASAIESSVVLIDGEMLGGLMIDHDVGTAVESSYRSSASTPITSTKPEPVAKGLRRGCRSP